MALTVSPAGLSMISRLPPSWRRRARIPGIPTPRLSLWRSRLPLAPCPSSRTISVRYCRVRTKETAAREASAWRWTLISASWATRNKPRSISRSIPSTRPRTCRAHVRPERREKPLMKDLRQTAKPSRSKLGGCSRKLEQPDFFLRFADRRYRGVGQRRAGAGDKGRAGLLLSGPQAAQGQARGDEVLTRGVVELPSDALALVILSSEQLLTQYVDLAIGAGDVGDVLVCHHQQRLLSKHEPSHPQLLDADLARELHLIGAVEYLHLTRQQGRQAGPQRLRDLAHGTGVQAVSERRAGQPGLALGFEYVPLASRVDCDGRALGIDDCDGERQNIKSRLQKPLALVGDIFSDLRSQLAVGG